jgi:3-oxoacyl-ACP reductase-like protein
MSVFSHIRDVIFGKKEAPKAAPQAQAQAQAPQPRSPQAPAAQKPAMPQMNAPAAAAAPAQPQPVDVDAVLAGLAAKNGEQLNYRSSIVDLMKLLGLDSSLANRKELADELGYSGAKDGSAEMNIWLHKAVMKRLAENGGKVSAELQG